MTTPLLHPPLHHGGLDKDRSNVFVKYLPPEIDNDGLLAMFGVFGKIVSAKVMVDQETGLSLGYGFVRFEHPKEAKKAISTMSGHKINNKTLLCRLSNNLAFPEPSTNLYIKPLPVDMAEGQLIEEFKEYGPILTVKIVREKGPPYARIGFVSKYENVECASKAIEEMNGTKLAPDQPPLIVKYAESETKRALRKAHALPKHIAKNNAARASLNSSSSFSSSSFPSSSSSPSFPLDLSLSLANLNLNSLPPSSPSPSLPSKLLDNSNVTFNNMNNMMNTNMNMNSNINSVNFMNNNNTNNNINNNNNGIIDTKTSPPIYEPSPSPVMVPFYVSPNEWYYGQAPFNNELTYARTPSYQVLLVPVGDVHFPVYSPRSQWTGPSFPPN